MTVRVHSYSLLWLGLALFPLLFFAMLLPLSPQDYWWYLRLGQDILKTGSVPAVDAYSYTQAGAPYLYQAWLAAVLFWKTYQAGGISLTFFVRGLIIAGTYGILWLLVREAGAGPRLASLLTFLAALVGSGNWSFRPQLFAYPLFMLTLFVLLRWAHGKARGVWIVPVLSILWVNLHGSFPLLFALGYLALIFGQGDRKWLGAAMGLATIAFLFNPHGVHPLGYVQNMLTSPSNQLSIEWAPTVNRGWQANAFFVWLLLFAPLAAISARKVSVLGWMYFLVFGWLALFGVRYVIWYSFILAVETGTLLGDWDNRHFDWPVRHERRTVNYLASILLLVIPFALLPGIRELWWSEAPRPYHDTNPIKATDWLSAHPELDGPLFGDFSHSSYLIYALPSRPVWIDPRFELYPTAQWETYTAIMSASPQSQNLLKEEGINLIMLSTAGEPALIADLRNTEHWCEVYHDEAAVIFHRTGAIP